jgi:hypothetical protein
VPLSSFNLHAPALRAIAARMQLEPVAALALRPGVTDVYRVTLHVVAGQGRSVVATLTRHRISDAALTVCFEGALAHKALHYPVARMRFDAFALALRRAGFDHLPDAPDLPALDRAEIWLVERAAGTYHHYVVIAPDTAQGAYSQVAEAVRSFLPEVLRKLES